MRGGVYGFLCYQRHDYFSGFASTKSIRYSTLTGKLARRSAEMIEAKRAAAVRTLGILESELATRPFIAGDDYGIADIALFAYASRAEEAGLSLQAYPQFRAWVARVEAQPGFLAEMYPYAIDPHSSRELP